MPRRPRVDSAGYAFHVLNRAARKLRLFRKTADYLAFDQIIAQTASRVPVRILAYVLMPTHWHFVLWPTADGQLSEFLRLLTVTHTQRHHAHYHTAGTGALYQGRFKSFPIQQDQHLLAVIRYVERNPLRANLCDQAQDWPHASPAKRGRESFSVPPPAAPWLCPPDRWPATPPPARQYAAWINRPQTQAELDALRQSLKRSRPFGDEKWTLKTAAQLHLQSTLKPPGRPRKPPQPGSSK